MKKKDKKKFKRKDVRLQNISIDDLEAFENDGFPNDKRASQKLADKAETSSKSNLQLKRGRVLEVKTNNTCSVKIDGQKISCIIGGRLKQMNYDTRSLVAVGDYVNVDMFEVPRIEEILPRQNSLSRFSEDSYQKEVILASNIDQIIITASVREPDLNLGLVDRYICAGRIAEIETVICVNKIDLAESRHELEDKLNFYKENGIIVIFTSIQTGEGMEELRTILQNKESVFSGHSGVGKSSLINFLQPDLNLKVSHVSDYTSKGIHTTTSSRLIEWKFGGYLVDTPGIKTFGLQREDKEKIYRIFPGVDVLSAKCKFADCSHDHEMDCAVKMAVEKGFFPLERYHSYLRIIESL